MLKNIIIVFLVGLLAWFFVFDKNPAFQNIQDEDSGSTLTEVPKDISENKEPSKLSLSRNKLDLSDQGLTKLPSYVLEKTSLEVLDISNNSLTGALPAEIRRLKNLKVLNASNNLMTGVPAEIGQLENLETLDLSNNKLTGLPYEMGNLKRLKHLNLSGNNYAEQDLNIIRQKLPKDVEITL